METVHLILSVCVFMALMKDLSFKLAEENEERTMIDPNSKEDAKFKELIKVRHILIHT